VTLVLPLLPFPFAVMLRRRRLWCGKIGLFLFPPLSTAPSSILSRNLPEPPPLPKVCNSLSLYLFCFFLIIYCFLGFFFFLFL
jgi:hypothetical protein